jgi:4'-phosphopantetheinyl transferase
LRTSPLRRREVVPGVHVWRCALDIADEELGVLAEVVSEEELGRASRLADPLAQRRALSFHGSRRRVLARYVGAPPRSLVFAREPSGRPRLCARPHSGSLLFSVSRSSHLGVIAVTNGGEVGIDVERIEQRHALGPIAEVLFSPTERAALGCLEDRDRTRRFFELWTRKEAHGKALGTGLAVPLRQLGNESERWSFHDVPVDGFVCTLCVDSCRARVLVFDHVIDSGVSPLPAVIAW